MHIPSKFSFLTWDTGSKIWVRMLSLGASYRKSTTQELEQSREVPPHIIGNAQLCQEPGDLPLLCLALASSLCWLSLQYRNSRHTSRQHNIPSREERCLFLPASFLSMRNLPPSPHSHPAGLALMPHSLKWGNMTPWTSCWWWMP